MDSVKDDNYYLKKIVADLEFMISHTQGKTQEEIKKDDLLIDSIHFRLIQIAENTDRISKEFKERYSQLPWRAIKGMRNRIVHNYGNVDLTVVCDTVLHSVPELYNELKVLV